MSFRVGGRLFAVNAGLRAVMYTALCAPAIWTAITAVGIAAAAYAPFPVGDQWWNLTPADNLPRLFAQHNEHRLVLARLLFEIDFRLFGGSGVFNLTLVYVFQILHAAVLIGLARMAGLAGTPLVATGGLVVSLLFWGAQIENFTSGFQHQFTGVFALAALAFAALARTVEAEQASTATVGGSGRPGSAGAGWIALSLLAAVGSVASMANGLAALGLLAAASVAMGLRRGRVALIVVTFVLLAAAYLNGYVTPAHHAKPSAVLFGAPDRVIAYVCLYLGGPFGVPLADAVAAAGWGPVDVLRRDFSIAFGAAAALGGVLAALAALRFRGPQRAGRLALASCGVFILATAFVTALGRADFPFEQALSSRYATPALALWAVLAIRAALLFTDQADFTDRAGGDRRRTETRAWAVWAWVAVAAVAGVVLAATQPMFIAQARAMGGNRALGAAAALSGVVDWTALVQVLPYRDFDVKEIDRARAARLGVFDRAWTETYGRALTLPTSTDDKICAGRIDGVMTVDTVGPVARRLSGVLTGGAAEGVVLTDETGVVVGFGMMSGKTWWAYARGDAARGVIAYGVAAGGKTLCRFAPAAPLPLPPVLSPLGATPPGRALTPQKVAVEGLWREGGVNAAVPLPPWPFVAWGSWVAADSDIGRLSLTVSVGAHRRFTLPVVTGPTHADLRVHLIDPVDGRVLARLDEPAEAKLWRLWRFSPPADWRGEAVTVIAEDRGAGWGQWLALGPLFAEDAE
jgi:hypothetical protein